MEGLAEVSGRRPDAHGLVDRVLFRVDPGRLADMQHPAFAAPETRGRALQTDRGLPHCGPTLVAPGLFHPPAQNLDRLAGQNRDDRWPSERSCFWWNIGRRPGPDFRDRNTAPASVRAGWVRHILSPSLAGMLPRRQQPPGWVIAVPSTGRNVHPPPTALSPASSGVTLTLQ